MKKLMLAQYILYVNVYIEIVRISAKVYFDWTFFLFYRRRHDKNMKSTLLLIVIYSKEYRHNKIRWTYLWRWLCQTSDAFNVVFKAVPAIVVIAETVAFPTYNTIITDISLLTFTQTLLALSFFSTWPSRRVSSDSKFHQILSLSRCIWNCLDYLLVRIGAKIWWQ